MKRMALIAVLLLILALLPAALADTQPSVSLYNQSDYGPMR